MNEKLAKSLVSCVFSILGITAVYFVLKGCFHYTMNPWEVYITYLVISIGARQLEG